MEPSPLTLGDLYRATLGSGTRLKPGKGLHAWRQSAKTVLLNLLVGPEMQTRVQH